MRGAGAGALALTLLLPACDPGSEGSGDTEGASGPEADLQEMVQTLCEHAQACVCNDVVHGEDGCESTQRELWQDRLRQATEAGLSYAPDCVEQRAETLGQVGCAFPATDGVDLCSSFCSPFVGERTMGQSCTAIDAVISDCAQGLVCSEGVCSEPCQVLTGLPLGATCMTDEGMQFDECVQGTFCSWETRSCQGLPELGQPCFEGRCAEGWCSYDGAMPVCQPAAGPGEPCQNIGCQPGLVCSWSANDQPVCLEPGDAGEPCADWQCKSGLLCSSQMLCIAPPGEGETCVSGQCQEGLLCDWDLQRCVSPPQGEGQPCPQGVCGSDLWCDQSQVPEGQCLPVLPLAAACTGHRQCDSGYCPRGYCLPLPGLGESCADADGCASGLVCNGFTCQLTQARGPAICVWPGL